MKDQLLLMKKRILFDSSKILFNQTVTLENFSQNWTVHHSEWKVEDGWLVGENSGNWPGMVLLKQDFPGNVLVEFEAYCSKIKIRNIVIRQIDWEPVGMKYEPEF